MPTRTSSRYFRTRNGKPTKLKIGERAVSKSARKVPGATLRCNDIERFFRDRYGATLPDDDSGRADAKIMLDHIYHRQAVDPLWLMNDWLDRWAPWLVGEERDAMIRAVFRSPMKYTADRLALELGLTFARRQRLGITTIGAIDADAAKRKELQQMRNTKQHAKARRDAGCMSRQEYEDTSLSKLKPWEALGISRPTYYRRQKEAETHYASDGLVSPVAYALATVRIV